MGKKIRYSISILTLALTVMMSGLSIHAQSISSDHHSSIETAQNNNGEDNAVDAEDDELEWSWLGLLGLLGLFGLKKQGNRKR